MRVVTFSADVRVLASGSEDGTIRLWTVSTGRLMAKLQDHTNCVWSLAFVGKMLISCGSDKTIKVWKENALIQTLSTSSLIYSVGVAPARDKIAVGCQDGGVLCLDVSFEARQARRRNVILLLAHLRRVDVMTGYSTHYVQHHVMPELPWQAWL